jgi:hypothetical protein
MVTHHCGPGVGAAPPCASDGAAVGSCTTSVVRLSFIPRGFSPVGRGEPAFHRHVVGPRIGALHRFMMALPSAHCDRPHAVGAPPATSAAPSEIVRLLMPVGDRVGCVEKLAAPLRRV